MSIPSLNLTGFQFSRWTVTSDKPGQLKCMCLCECGKSRLVFKKDLLNGRSKSCSCIRRSKPQQYNYIQLYTSYKRNANRRNIIFNLNFNEFKELTLMNCFYCDKKPSNIKKYLAKTTIKEWAEQCKIIYSGIDRIDNNLGYEWSNSVACCAICNSMKSRLTIVEFKSQVIQIYTHLGLKNV